MRWGMACGDGWFALLDTLCTRLQFETDHNGAPQVVAVQVKQKLGALRVHVSGANEFQRGLLALAADLSLRICEECGHPGQLVNSDGFLTARCAAHTPAGSVLLLSEAGTAQHIRDLARLHNVQYVRTGDDALAEVVSALAGDEGALDEIEQLLIALERAGVVASADVVPLHVRYLRERFGCADQEGAC